MLRFMEPLSRQLRPVMSVTANKGCMWRLPVKRCGWRLSPAPQQRTVLSLIQNLRRHFNLLKNKPKCDLNCSDMVSQFFLWLSYFFQLFMDIFKYFPFVQVSQHIFLLCEIFLGFVFVQQLMSVRFDLLAYPHYLSSQAKSHAWKKNDMFFITYLCDPGSKKTSSKLNK